MNRIKATRTAAETLTDTLNPVPNEWWRYVPCSLCRAGRHEPCVQLAHRWPNPARGPHAARRQDGLLLHGTLWLLANFPLDVLDPPANDRSRP